MTEMITSTEKHLKQIVPQAQNIVIKVARDHELFSSKIHMHLPGKVIHAQKKAQTLSEALDSTCDAVLKQIEKNKGRRLRKR